MVEVPGGDGGGSTSGELDFSEQRPQRARGNDQAAPRPSASSNRRRRRAAAADGGRRRTPALIPL
ncbi:unnamed protein product [Cuscuta epithymum]|uniref:Uncharacterized protein n=1 Tax=Cuscuta epithymum TaxID=186058 RepID=A0AAV0ECF1_9ASTE|nr:unnamed protein product [Cuscuta epithymum]CAH9121788.1 unnamed protein product [Cuscuta epithymum]